MIARMNYIRTEAREGPRGGHMPLEVYDDHVLAWKGEEVRKKLGDPMRNRNPAAITVTKIARMLAMRQEGRTVSEVAAVMGVSCCTVATYAPLRKYRVRQERPSTSARHAAWLASMREKEQTC